MTDAGLSGVLVLIYLDDVLVVGRGRARVRKQTARGAEALRRAGAVVSPKGTLEPVQRLVWLGKDIDLGGGGGADCWQRMGGSVCALVEVVCGAL